MASYPYTSGQSAIVQAIAQLRKGLPPKIDAGYLQRFNIARANESYIISILRFLGLINEEGNPVDKNTDYFFGDDDTFERGLDRALRAAYSQLFDEMGEDALSADRDKLIGWFRAADKTTAVVGQRQASTFQMLAALAGHRDLPAVRTGGARNASTGRAASPPKSATKKGSKRSAGGAAAAPAGVIDGGGGRNATSTSDVGLTVRIEVNLPPDGDQATYDAIFASIKKHLLK